MNNRTALNDGNRWTTTVVLPDGAHTKIRPLRADDRAREIEFLDGLSDRTRYLRLLAPLRFLPPYMIDQFMDVDGERRMAFVATIETEGVEHFIGVVRYAVTDDPTSAEIGITVTDAWHGRGVASRLLQQLSKYAQCHGVKTLTGLVLPENDPMLRLARRNGFDVHLSIPEHLMRITKTLIGA